MLLSPYKNDPFPQSKTAVKMNYSSRNLQCNTHDLHDSEQGPVAGACKQGN
jgi:hypothetical protein